MGINKYVNPVFEPDCADPTIIRGEDGMFYAYSTQTDYLDGKGTRYMPIVKSEDLVNWQDIGSVFKQSVQWRNDGGFWAPCIVKIKDKYVLYYSVSIWDDPNAGIGIAVSDNPAGPFEDHGKLFDSKGIGVHNSIDPHVYVEDGIPYMFWGSFYGIYAVKLSDDGLSIVSDKFHIAGNSFEAVHTFKEKEYYYFIGSIGSCCDGLNSTYNMRVARSKNILGPYLDKDGKNIFDGDATLFMGPGIRYVGVGHHTIIQDDNNDYYVLYHAIDTKEDRMANNITRRPMMIDKISWDEGWPYVENEMPSEEERPYPIIRREV